MVDEDRNFGETAGEIETGQGFTPGPWKIETPPDRDEEDTDWGESYPRGVTVRAKWNTPREDGALGYEICRMSGVHEHTLANARLIAAAPALYEALKEILNFGIEFDDERIGYIAAQIDKATIADARAALALVDKPATESAKRPVSDETNQGQAP